MSGIVGELEYQDVLKTCVKLYSDILDENNIELMAKWVMELDELQNSAYEMANKICLLVDKPDVIKQIMNDQHITKRQSQPNNESVDMENEN